MKEIIKWLIHIEKIASDFYFEAATYFKENTSIRKFLEHSAKEESQHYHIMVSALAHVNKMEVIDLPFTLNAETKARIEAPFINNLKKVYDKCITDENLVDCIIQTEYSEWNNIFLYVINRIKDHTREFYYAVADIQKHMRRTQHFLESTEYGSQQFKKLRSLDKIFMENILIVDDEPGLRELLDAILCGVGHVDTAVNGEEALQKVDEKYYRLIISDINMPVMDGITFYKAAVKNIPSLHDKFLFISSYLPHELCSYMDKQGVAYLQKPASISKIKNMAFEIMNRP